MSNTIRLLTDEERIKLPFVIARRNKARQIIKLSIANFNTTFSNCIMIQGKPGTGKTTLVEELLAQLAEDNDISAYKRVPGHITPRSLFGVLKETHMAEVNSFNNLIPKVLVLDDVDCLGDEGCLELLKAAFDTKSNAPTNRNVFYYNEKDGKQGLTYGGFGIIITNDDFGKKKLSVHQRALVDRVQQMSFDLEPEDLSIFNIHLIEKMLNENEDNLSDKEIESIVTLFNTEIRRWLEKDAFRKANIDFSTRLIKKFVDSQRLFGDDWKMFNVAYRQLDSACQLAELTDGDRETADVIPEPSKSKVRKAQKTKTGVKLIKKSKSSNGLPPKNRKGEFVHAKTGKPYCYNVQLKYRKMEKQIA